MAPLSSAAAALAALCVLSAPAALANPAAPATPPEFPLTTAVANVTTGAELRGAVYGGFEHILITQHLDLSEEPVIDLSFATEPPRLLLHNPAQLKTLRGNCAAAPPAEMIEGLTTPVAPGQCVLTFSGVFLSVTGAYNGDAATQPDMWLDNLYLRNVGTDDSLGALWFVPRIAGSHLWLSNTVVNAGGHSMGIYVSALSAVARQAQATVAAFIDGCTIEGALFSGLWTVEEASVAVRNTAFIDNGSHITFSSTRGTRVENSTFQGSGDLSTELANAPLFTDMPAAAIARVAEGPAARAILPLSGTSGYFPSAGLPRFTALQQAVGELPVTRDIPDPPAGAKDDKWRRIGIIAAIVGGAVLLGAAIAGSIICFQRQQAKRQRQHVVGESAQMTTDGTQEAGDDSKAFEWYRAKGGDRV